MNKKSSRKISKFEYLVALQKEVLMFALRRKIYPYEHQVSSFCQTMDKKKRTIIDIAIKSNIPTIYDERRVFDKYLSEFMPATGGFPKFEYLDRKSDEFHKAYDLKNYYALNSHVIINISDSEFYVGTIKEVQKEHNLIKASYRYSMCESYFTPEKVTRIINISFDEL